MYEMGQNYMDLYEIKIDIDSTVSFIFDGNVYTYSETPSMHAHSLYEIVYVLSDQAVIEFEQSRVTLNMGDAPLWRRGFIIK